MPTTKDDRAAVWQISLPKLFDFWPGCVGGSLLANSQENIRKSLSYLNPLQAVASWRNKSKFYAELRTIK